MTKTSSLRLEAFLARILRVASLFRVNVGDGDLSGSLGL